MSGVAILIVEDYRAIAARCRELRGCQVRRGGMAAECFCRQPDGSYTQCPLPAAAAPVPDPLAPVRRRCAELGIRPLWGSGIRDQGSERGR